MGDTFENVNEKSNPQASKRSISHQEKQMQNLVVKYQEKNIYIIFQQMTLSLSLIIKVTYKAGADTTVDTNYFMGYGKL